MNENKIFIAIGAATLLLLIGIVFLAGKLDNSAKVGASDSASAEVKTNSYDWGQIGINNGKAEAVFEIKSNGSQSLKLFNITTSCACTTAQTIVEDKASPLFDMHSKTTYVTEVPPGKTAQLKVVFDPLFHGPNGLGAITRQVTVATNDAKNPALTFNLSANVVK